MTVSNKHITRKDFSQQKTAVYFQKYVSASFWHSTSILASNIVVTETDINPILSPEAIKVISRIQSFKHLEQNWDHYNAERPSAKAIQEAVRFIKQLDQVGLEVFFTAPGPNGEVVVELKNEKKAAEVYFYPDQEADYVLFDGEETVDEAVLNNRIYNIIQFIQ